MLPLVRPMGFREDPSGRTGASDLSRRFLLPTGTTTASSSTIRPFRARAFFKKA